MTGLVLFSWLPHMLNLNPNFSYGDEGIIAQAAYRIVKGEVPFRDFFTGVPPLSLYWPALFLALFGPTFFALRLSVMVTGGIVLVGSMLALERLGARHVSSFAVLLSFLAFFGGPFWFVASHHWISSAFCLLSFALVLPSSEDVPSPRTLVASGVAAAAAALSLQHKGGAWILLASLLLWAFRRNLGKKALLHFWAGIAGFALPAFLLLASRAGFFELIHQMVVFPLTRYHQAASHQEMALLEEFLSNWKAITYSWALHDTWTGWLKMVTWTSGSIGRCLLVLIPLAGVVSLFVLWRTPRFSRQNTAFLAALMSAMYLGSLHRPSEATFSFAAAAAVLPLALALEVTRGNQRSRLVSRFVKIFTLCWIILFTTVATGFFALEYLPGEKPVDTPAGTVHVIYNDEAASLAGVIGYIEKNRDPGDSIFVYRYSPLLYFLLQVDNPTRFDAITIGMNTESQIDEVLESLDKLKCRWIIWDYTLLNNNRIGHYITRNYRLKAGFKKLAVFEVK